MALYYVLLHGWLGLGEGEAAVRLLSVLCAAATIPVVYLLALQLFDGATAALAALLTALNPSCSAMPRRRAATRC